ncbi:hypothetical protein RvY_00327 [Ramazzottius varieornatus]|uniref:BAR domain-containing protein n=1 Tax=Ramazzottius varieornatus TaxID=947166 RepID=A0A1D1UMB5_RAMVA|nr:hypothetical protein RvY_00327 [Ramazzottius varieornatus]
MDLSYLTPIFETTSLEYQAKISLARAEKTQENFGNFCHLFSTYSRIVAQARDRGDVLSTDLKKYAEEQQSSPTSKQSYDDFASLLYTMQSQEEARVRRLESKVVAGFSKYSYICYSFLDHIKKAMAVREREHKKAEDFARNQNRFIGNINLKHHKQEKVQTAVHDSKRAQELLKRESDKFEGQKNEDLRRILMNFAEVELVFHAQALELYTSAYNLCKTMGSNADIAHFRKSIAVPLAPPEGNPLAGVNQQLSGVEVKKEEGVTGESVAGEITAGEDSGEVTEILATTDEATVDTADETAQQPRGSVKAVPKRPRRKSSVRRSSLTPAQIRRFSKQFGVSEKEYREESTHNLAEHPKNVLKGSGRTAR